MNISPIFAIPILSEKVKLTILPLVPISMVSELPGSYYKSNLMPSKFHLSGLFENLLGWHLSNEDRLTIIKEVEKTNKKHSTIPELKKAISYSGYIPLLYNLFEVNLSVASDPMHFDDIWKKAYRRVDAIVHPNGTPNLDYNLIKIKRTLKRKDERPQQVDDKEMEKLFKANLGKFPFYYSTVSKREYLKFEGVITIILDMQKEIFILLKQAIENNNLVFLGTSDSWIDLKIEMI